MKYIVIASKNIKALVSDVNKALKEGYKPLGNISVEYTGYLNSPNFYQAMIKD